MSIANWKAILFSSIGILVLMGLSGCEKAPQKMESLNIASANQPSNALTFIAQEKGFFRDAGLEVSIEDFPSGKRALQDGFLNPDKKFDLAITSDMPFSSAIHKGHSLVTFAHIFSTDDVNRIVARKDRNIFQLPDLAGHTIGTQENSAVHYFLTRILEAYNLNNSEVNVKFMAAEALPTALSKGSIDAFSMREPYVTQARDMIGEDNLSILGAYGVYHQYDVLVSAPEIIQMKVPAFEKFVSGLLQAQDFAINHPEEALDIVAKKLNISVQSLKKTLSLNDLKIGLQQGLLMTLESQQAWLASLDSQKMAHNSNQFTDFFYFPLLESVAPELIAIIRPNSGS